MNLYLVGYRGSGKTTVASRVAQRLNRRHVDTDELIEQKTKHTIQDIFACLGEKGFRKIESELIGSFRAEDEWVVSLGGGAILAEENRSRLKQTGKVIWLQATPEVLLDRIESDPMTANRRPKLTQLDDLEEVRQTLAAREPLYAEVADFKIDASELEIDEIVRNITEWLIHNPTRKRGTA